MSEQFDWLKQFLATPDEGDDDEELVPDPPEVKLVDYFWARVRQTRTCWFWVGYIDRNGYGVAHPGDAQTWLAHRVAWELFCGSIPEKLSVGHTCPNRACVNPRHLYLITGFRGSRKRATP